MEWKQKSPKIKYRKKDSVLRKLVSINGVEDMDSFLNPDSKFLHDPYLLKNIDIARNIIIAAMHERKMISIFFDIDADGLCSGAIMFNYIKKFTDNVCYFHAQRSAGHGIHTAMKFIPEGTELLIIVDSSSSEAAECERLLADGIENIIIIDHHIMDKENLHAIIVNPQQDEYPNKSISGSGLCWKMCQVLDDNLGEEYSKDLIDLAGVGMIADVMSLKEMENRYIISEALDNFENCGLKAMIENNPYANLFDLSVKDISFSIAPLLNATSRMDKIEFAIKLLTTDDRQEAVLIATDIQIMNNTRKEMQAFFIEKFTPLLNDDDRIIVITDDKIGKGFSGLVAGELANLYRKPVVIIQHNPKNRRKTMDGSFRSYGSFKLKSFFESLPFEYSLMAGHEGAGGIGFKVSSLENFKEIANEYLKNVEFEQSMLYDLEIDASDITEEMLQEVKDFNRLSGQNVSEAKFLVKNLLADTKDPKMKAKNILKVKCSNGMVLMKFRTSKKYIEEFPTMEKLEVVGALSLNVFKMKQGNFKKEIKTIQVILDDYRIV